MNNYTNVDGVNRLMTDDEQAEYDTWVKQHKKEVAAEAKAEADAVAAKQAVLTKLGITEAEARMLLS